jgi:hypothetical protein
VLVPFPKGVPDVTLALAPKRVGRSPYLHAFRAGCRSSIGTLKEVAGWKQPVWFCLQQREELSGMIV